MIDQMGLDNPLHIAFLLVLLLLVFGAKRLPEMGRSLGAGLRGFKETVSGENVHASLTPGQSAPPQAATTPAPTPATEATPRVGEPSVPAA
jgi:sec-independent protein translocase protein TatA